MKHSTPKEQVLKKIRAALIQKTDQPFPDIAHTDFYESSDDPLDLRFANEFKAIGGNFIYCSNEEEFEKNLRSLAEEKGWNHMYCWDLVLQGILAKYDFRKCRIGKNIDKADAGITLCEALVARTGSVLISSRQASGRTLSIFPPAHIIVAYTTQLVPDIKEGFDAIKEKYNGDLPSMINLNSGPSRTADIEKTLVLGAHGPKESYVFLLDSPLQ
jgi:L-lactate dehydrogenase complex protein LldG